MNIHSRRAFTLLELLVVISIIAVLAGILLPVGSGVLDRAKKVDAKVTMTNAVTAIKAYQTEYGQYPIDPGTATGGGTPQDTTFDTGTATPSDGKGGRNGYLFDVLRALNNPTGAGGTAGATPEYKALNSRKIVYFESRDVKNPADPRGGFIPSAGSSGAAAKAGFSPGDLVDPFGNLFCFRIDSNYSDAIAQPYKITGDFSAGFTYTNGATDDPSTANNSSKILRVAAAGFSAGKDGKFGDDNGALTSSCDDVVTWQ